jgi:hypothetical protein
MGALRNSPNTLFFQENAESAAEFQGSGNKLLVKTGEITDRSSAKCEAHHMTPCRYGLLTSPTSAGFWFRRDSFSDHAADFKDEIMSTRRKAYWWFWFVASGRFLETFLNLRGKRS